MNSSSSSDLAKGIQKTMGEQNTEFSLPNLYPVFNHWTSQLRGGVEGSCQNNSNCYTTENNESCAD